MKLILNEKDILDAIIQHVFDKGIKIDGEIELHMNPDDYKLYAEFEIRD